MADIDDTAGRHDSLEPATLDAAGSLADCGQPSPVQPRRPSLRTWLVGLVLACVLPVWAVTVFFVYQTYQQRRMLLEQRVMATTRTLSLVVDGEIAAMEATLSALASSQDLAKGNLEAFNREARAARNSYPGTEIIVADADGRQLVNTYVPYGTPLPRHTDRDALRQIFQTGQPVISNLFEGPVQHRLLVAVNAPVIRDGRVVYDLAISVPASRFQMVFSRQSVPPDWPATILDGNRVIVARNIRAEQYVGQPTTVTASTEAPEGVMKTQDREGVPVFAVYSRSPRTGWTVTTGIPRAVMLAEVRRLLWWTAGGALLVSLLGIALALYLVRRIASSIRALTGPALALGTGQAVEIGPLDLAETHQVGQSLVKASQLLQQHMAERERAEQAILQAEVEARHRIQELADAAHASRRQLQEVIDGAAEIVVFVKDADGRFMIVNSRFEELLGVTRDEVQGKTDYDLLTRERADYYRSHDRLVLTTGRPIQVEEIARLADGKEHIFLANKFPLIDGCGQPYAVCAISVDITERKRAEQSIAHLASFPELNPAVIFETDLEGRIAYANPAALRRFPTLGNAGAEPPLLREWSSVIASFKAGGEPAITREIEAEGEHLLQNVHYCPEIGVVRAYVVNITERKRAEQALLRSEKLASMGRMAATISHEINNPLEAVTNLLYLVRTAHDAASAQQYLEMADTELKRVAHITRQSLGFYRESNAPAPVSVTGLLRSTVELLESRIKGKRAAIETQWDGEVTVSAVAGELRQVFSNLLANSLDAIDAAGTIKLRVSGGAASGYVRITVADNGKGIDARSRRRLFEPFFTTKGSTGTGLGLWVSKQLIEKHGGSIRVRSRIEGARRGTTFSVVVPVEPAPRVSAEP